MSLITGSIKDVLSIKIKPRYDSYTDQFSRIFMAKMFIISSLIMSVDFFSDKVSCIVPNTATNHLSSEFVHSACWIQGFYVYEELTNRTYETGYFGIPKNVEMNGINSKGVLCTMIDKTTSLRDLDCKEMTKRYYLQYQYFPFFVASLAILFYLPYIVFRLVNNDLITLKDAIKEHEIDASQLVDSFFNYRYNGGKWRLRMKVAMNVLIKITYLGVNIGAFYAMDTLLYGNYADFGVRWVQWAELNNTMRFDYMGMRNFPKPGNVLLPAMGFCEINEGATNKIATISNHNKFICEISPNVLYQYVMTVLWFMFVSSIAVSALGVLINISQHALAKALTMYNRRGVTRSLYSRLTWREVEYLMFMKKKNLPLYGCVVRMIESERNMGNGKARRESSAFMNGNMGNGSLGKSVPI